MKRTCLLLIILLISTHSVLAQRTMTAGDGLGKMSYFTCPSMGEMRFPVILVSYQDVGFSERDVKVVKHFNDFFNKEGYSTNGATGSVRDYFLSASAGRFVPQFDVLGTVKLANKRAYYGDGEGTAAGHPEEMVIEAVKAVKERVDFSRYDNDHDGYVDDVIVIYAGNAERFGASNAAVLPTSFLISFNKYWEEEFMMGYQTGGMHFDSYTVTSELAYGKYDGIGTFLHEFSHALGLADEYNVWDTAADYTPQEFDLMDVGLYNNNSCTPPTYSAFERFALGWIDLEVIDGPCTLTLEPLDKSNKAYIIPVTADEFFILENRQQQGWDAYLPDHGLLVWHIDYDQTAWYDNAANKEKNHQRIALSHPTESMTLPTWCGKDVGLAITDIQESDGVVRMRITDAAGLSLPAELDQCLHIYDLGGRRITSFGQTGTPLPGIYLLAGKQSARKMLVQ